MLLLIIGAQKSGTTTLFDMLSEAACFCPSPKKEVGFFTKDFYYEKGEDWYWQQFQKTEEKIIKLEATPEYMYFPFAPQRISLLSGKKKFIVLLREPVERCYSAWNMFRIFNQSYPREIYDEYTKYANKPQRDAIKSLLFCSPFPSFDRAIREDIDRYDCEIDDLEPSFVRRGIYYDQIKNFLKFFPMSDFLFLEQRDLNSPEQVFDQISNFLDFNILPISKKFQSNKGQYIETIDSEDETIALLKEFYAPHNERLFNLIGKEYDWSVF